VATLRPWLRVRLAAAAQARVGLEGFDHLEEIVEPDDPLELETGAVLGGPDQVRLDAADDRTSPS